MRSLTFLLAFFLAGQSHAATYTGTWKGSLAPVANTCAETPQPMKASLNVLQVGKHVYVKLPGKKTKRRGNAYKTNFSVGKGVYKRANGVLCLKRHLWQLQSTGKKSGNLILLYLYGCSDGTSCATSWQGDVTK